MTTDTLLALLILGYVALLVFLPTRKVDLKEHEDDDFMRPME